MPFPDKSVTDLVRNQRAYFQSGATGARAARLAALNALEHAIRAADAAILAALRDDLGKSASDAYSSEVGFVLAEIGHARRNLRAWVRPSRARSPLLLQPASSAAVPEPRGVALILSPWNYPFQLAMSPLVAALAAGNTVVLKPSEHAPRTASVLSEVIGSAFPPEHVCVVTGGSDTATALLAERFGAIFFTGSTATGRRVAEAAARTLTPCTLELGGKSPCIVCDDANLPVAARRIAWGKFLNAGQTCVAPDTVWADRRIVAPLLAELARAVVQFYGADARGSSDYGRIATATHFDRLRTLLQPGRIVCGGDSDRDARYLAPTILADVPPDAAILYEEIFGPILPVVAFDDLNALLTDMQSRPTPLALYVFSESRAKQDIVLTRTRSGNACVNDTVLQILNPRLPFGGLGDSGFGAYHGKAGFDTFSHLRTVVRRGTRRDPAFRYPPTTLTLKWLRRLLPWLLR